MVVGNIDARHTPRMLVAVDHHQAAGFMVGRDDDERLAVRVGEFQRLGNGQVEAQHFDNRTGQAARMPRIVDLGALDHQEKPVAAAFLQFGDRSARGIGQQCQVGLLGRIVHRLVDAR